jgi:hypothetical protein
MDSEAPSTAPGSPPQRSASGLNSTQALDAVLLDDDALVRLVWEYTAAKKEIRLRTFSDPEALLAAAETLALGTPLYIDSSLSHSVRGEEVAKLLVERGFNRVYLATGHLPCELPEMPWLTGIQGKEPPW